MHPLVSRPTVGCSYAHLDWLARLVDCIVPRIVLDPV